MQQPWSLRLARRNAVTWVGDGTEGERYRAASKRSDYAAMNDSARAYSDLHTRVPAGRRLPLLLPPEPERADPPGRGAPNSWPPPTGLCDGGAGNGDPLGLAAAAPHATVDSAVKADPRAVPRSRCGPRHARRYRRIERRENGFVVDASRSRRETKPSSSHRNAGGEGVAIFERLTNARPSRDFKAATQRERATRF